MAYYLNGEKRYIAYCNGKRHLLKTARVGGEETLTAPTISIDGDTLTIQITDKRAKTLAIFVDGVEMATVGV